MSECSAPGWTHVPTLVKAVLHTTGPVLEFGAGMYSTPLLHELCRNRRLVTVEENHEWAEYARRFGHEVLHTDYATVRESLAAQEWGVVFIDHNAHHRPLDFAALVGKAQACVVHDWLDRNAQEDPWRGHRWWVEARHEPATALTGKDIAAWADLT